MKRPTIEELKEHPFHVPQYIKKNYPELYEFIESQGGSFREVLWKYYNGDPKPCPVCGKLTKFVNFFVGYREFCSSKCQAIGTQQRKEQTMMRRYGSKNPMHVKEFRDKNYETNPFNDPEIQKRIQKKQIERYGGMARGSKKTRAKIDAVKEAKYGDPYFNNREKYAKTCLERYGRVGYCDEEKRLETARKNYIKSNDRRVIGYTDDGDWIVKCPHPECEKCAEKTFITYWSVDGSRINTGVERCTKLNPVNNLTSQPEKDLLKYIESIYVGRIESGARILYFDTPHPKEIDIYLPKLNLGFEFNGSYHHSLAEKEPDYHFKKWKAAKELGIRLITIWGHDWSENKSDIKNFIFEVIMGNKDIKLINDRYIHLDNCSYNEWISANPDDVILEKQKYGKWVFVDSGKIKKEAPKEPPIKKLC